jgi:hypothetical protein
MVASGGPAHDTADPTSAAPIAPPLPLHRREFAAVYNALRRELRGYLEHDGVHLRLRSPLVCQIPLHDIARANEEFLTRDMLVHHALLGGDMATAIMHVEKPYRLALLGAWWHAGGLTAAALRRGLVRAWPSVEFVHPETATALRLFRNSGFVTDADDARHNGHAPAEHENAAAAWPADVGLSGNLTLYRGAAWCRDAGLSWSLQRETAACFATRAATRFPPGDPWLITATLPAKHALGYFVGRGEATIIADPADVRVLRRELLTSTGLR